MQKQTIFVLPLSPLTATSAWARARTAHERQALERQIEATDHEIDQLVYELYGLTAAEIRIVEGEAPANS
ncbi:MAG: hypothetical protein L0Y72_15335 [Gemmataceae bacterium]|nr:hypothetical protein [Gemmataceae bacterium]MCI0740418.1 hypothetical protein [Gemmataceae bacterium]